MTQEIKISVEAIDETSIYLSEVIELGDANKATLGFFPKGAFEQKARNKQILVAFSDTKEFMGYLMYVNITTYNRINIIHLCIKNDYRGQGITRRLIEELKTITYQYNGIGLTCRRDYGINDMWTKLGFWPSYEKKAKTPGKLLTYWWLDYGHPNLFSLGNEHKREAKLSAIIDYSMFEEIYLPHYLSQIEEEKSKESQALLADWLQPSIEIWVTNEILNQIDTIKDDHKRKAIRDIFSELSKVHYTDRQYQKFQGSLESFIIKNKLKIEQSYIRHLAQSLASGINVILTNNTNIIQLSDQFYEKFQVTIINPNDFINCLDDIDKQADDQSRLLEGMNALKQVKINSSDEKKLKNDLLKNCSEEEKQYFVKNLRHFILKDDTHECLKIEDEDKELIAVLVYDRSKKNQLEIPICRITEHSLAKILARHLLFTSISLSAQEGRNITKITDRYLQNDIINILQEDYFIKINDEALKLNFSEVDTKENIADKLSILGKNSKEFSHFCEKFSETLRTKNLNQETILQIERYLFPLKIIDHNIDNFIIPIKPKWASDLFDRKLAQQTLFGSSEIQLALNREAVYYKSKKAPRQLYPGISGRIFWYVSNDKDKGLQGISSIRACSRLDEVVIDKPKELYRKYRHLGIYKLSDLLKVAKNNENEDIMAIKFSDTELFTNPVTLKDVQNVIENKTTFTSSFYINNEKFAIIYKQGMKEKRLKYYG